jgi:hypothetical protein
VESQLKLESYSVYLQAAASPLILIDQSWSLAKMLHAKDIRYQSGSD